MLHIGKRRKDINKGSIVNTQTEFEMKGLESTGQQLAAEVINQCIRITNDTDKCAFFSYSGHINCCEVHIAKSKEEFNTIIWESWPLMKITNTHMLNETLDYLLPLGREDNYNQEEAE